MPPRDVAARLAVELEQARPGHLDRVEVAGPGFLNLHLSPSWLHEVLLAVVAQGDGYGHGHALDGLRINLEFVSANPTGPLHAGGGRWVAVGDALANLLAAQGAVVHREYYLNDAGNQLDTFAASLMARYEGRSAARRRLPGPVPDRHGRSGCAPSSATASPRSRPASGAIATPCRRCRSDLARIGVHFDTWFSERTLHEAGNVVARARRPPRAWRRRRARWRHLAARHRVRRPARPGAGEVRRLHHLSLQRHRLPPRQVRPRVGAPHRHLGRRPPRTGEVAPGRHGGARVSRRASPRCCSVSW